eukprot:808623-Heterocapsa_arctica.AAC.1
MLACRSISMLSIVERKPWLSSSDCHERQAPYGKAIHTSECRPAFACVSNSTPSACTLPRHDMS